MASHRRPDADIDLADHMARGSGGLDMHPDNEFTEEYDKAQNLIGVIHGLVDGLTFAPGYTPSAPVPARDLRKRSERLIDSDGTLKPFPINSTAASLIAEDLVPPDYRVRTS